MAVDLSQNTVLDDQTVLTLPLQDDGTVAIKVSDLQKLVPSLTPTIDETSGDWIVGGQTTMVKAIGTQITIDENTKNWLIDGKDTGVLAVGTVGPQGPSGRDALTFSLDAPVLGENVGVENVATEDGQVRLKFTLPAPVNGVDGKDGKTPTIKIGNVTTGDVPAITDNVSDDNVHTLDVVLPRVDMSNYATIDSLNKGLNDKQSKQDMASYYDATSVDKLLANKADLTTIANVPTKVDVQNINDKLDRLTTQVNDLTGQLNAVKQENAALKAQLATTSK